MNFRRYDDRILRHNKSILVHGFANVAEGDLTCQGSAMVNLNEKEAEEFAG
jgi:hypothetical protein